MGVGVGVGAGAGAKICLEREKSKMTGSSNPGVYYFTITCLQLIIQISVKNLSYFMFSMVLDGS